MSAITQKLKGLVEERDRHNQELAGLQEMMTQKVSRVNYLNGGIANLYDLLSDEEKAKFDEDYRKSLQPQQSPVESSEESY